MKAYLVFLDESGFLLVPTVRRTWAPRGKTPIVRHRYRRDKISVISAVTLSPARTRCGLYAHFHYDNITHVETALFLRLLLRHLRGHVIVLLDNGSIHRGQAVQAVLARHPRLHLEWFPSYAPELNPDELVWRYLKGHLANGAPDDVDELMDDLTRETRRVQSMPAILHAFILGSELPSPFSRPARRSLALRPACVLSRLSRPFFIGVFHLNHARTDGTAPLDWAGGSTESQFGHGLCAEGRWNRGGRGHTSDSIASRT